MQSAPQFQSAPPSRAATVFQLKVQARFNVSIRAALTGGDGLCASLGWLQPSFNPRRPHGRRLEKINRLGESNRFQSAPPSRAATRCCISSVVIRQFQSAPPSRAATRQNDKVEARDQCFNPRRPHGRRHITNPPEWEVVLFQSAPPSRAATVCWWRWHRFNCVSIRAALTGGDGASMRGWSPASSFNPRRPHGRRRRAVPTRSMMGSFQSAPPSRAATSV